MSLCDKCYAPGACCRSLGLSRESGGALTVWTDTDIPAQMAAYGLPFEPGLKVGEWKTPEGRPYAQFLWSCPKLTADGRCSIYDDRPDLCRKFEAGSDPLCVHWRGAEAGADAL